MTSNIEPKKILFKINDINNNSNRREMSFRLPNNSKIQFTLYCRPNCNLPDHDGKFTLVYLYLASSDKPRVSIQYRLSFVGTSGKNIHVHEGKETFVANTNSSKFGGLYKIDQSILLDRSNELIDYEYLSIWDEKVGRTTSKRVEKLTICCEIKEIGIVRESNLVQNPNSFIQNFQDLLESGKYSDAVLFVGGKELKVHKNILSVRSKVFSAMFEHDCEEKKQNRVEITDIQLDVMEELLRYIYMAKIESMDKLAVELLVASDKYELIELKNLCERYLIENLSIETVANIHLLADLHKANQLNAKCIDFISENAKKVQTTSGWNALATKSDLIMEIFLKQTEKYELIKNPLPKIEAYRVKYDDEYDFLNYLEYQLKNDFGELLENEKFSDVVFILEDGELRAHKNILTSRSRVFANIFEQEQDRIEMADVSVEVCKQLLRYIYTDADYMEYSLDKKYANELLMLSEKYELSDLKAKSERQLSQTLEIKSVSSTLLLADQQNALYLKTKCIEFITENCRKVTQTEEWKMLAKTKPELGIQLYEHIAAKQWC